MTTAQATLLLFLITSYRINSAYANNNKTGNGTQHQTTSPPQTNVSQQISTPIPGHSAKAAITKLPTIAIKATSTTPVTTAVTPVSSPSITILTPSATQNATAQNSTSKSIQPPSYKSKHSADISAATSTTTHDPNESSQQTFSTDSSTELPTSSNVTINDLNTTDYTTEPTETSTSSISINNTSPTQTSSISSSTKTTTQIPTTLHQASTVAPKTDGTSVQTKTKTATITERHTTKRQSTSFVSVTKIPVTNSKTEENSLTGSSAQTLSTETTVAPTVARSTKYETYPPINGTDCRLGFILKNDLCVYLCEDKVCQNDGVCSLVNDMAGNKSVAMCRCKIDDDVEYSGESCETSKPSRLTERKITLGILLPLTCIILLILTCTCLKLKRNGKAARALGNNYDLNSGAL